MVERIVEQFDPERVSSSARGRAVMPGDRAMPTCSR